MNEAVFIFTDDDCEMAVAVKKCDDDRARKLLTAAITSKMALPLKDFDAIEFAAVFVAVNKKEPYDILFCGELREDENLLDIKNVYDCHSNGECLVVTPMAFDDEGEVEPMHLWALKKLTVH
tara:strand:+ start:1110 stop:1475 length:366 start_codon:yes stop_codon:yes gene_type:complete